MLLSFPFQTYTKIDLLKVKKVVKLPVHVEFIISMNKGIIFTCKPH